jgi:MFS family permease
MGLGTFILVPFSQYAISTWGWRLTFILLGGLVMIVLLPLNGLFLRHKPQDLGLLPDGLDGSDYSEENNPETYSQPLSIDWTLKIALKTKAFWALFAFPFLSIIGIYFILVYNVKFMVDHGIDKMTAAFIFALIGVISSVFRIVWGGLSDRIGREKTYTMGMICGIMGLISLLFMDLTGEQDLAYPFFIFFGMGWGVSAPMFMAVAADLFKGKEFGLIYGIVEAGIGVAGAFGAWVGGFIFDHTQSYQGAIVLSIIVMILSCVGIWIAAPRKARTTVLH